MAQDRMGVFTAAIVAMGAFESKADCDDYGTTVTEVSVASLSITHNRSRSRFAQFKLGAHLL
jgi:hypothetical protein